MKLTLDDCKFTVTRGKEVPKEDNPIKCKSCGRDFYPHDSYMFHEVNGFCSYGCWKEYNQEILMIGVK